MLPVFIGVGRVLRDKRAKAAEVIYAKAAGAGRIIWSRFGASTVLLFIPVLLIGLLIQMPYLYHARTLGIAADALAFIKYPTVWLLPQIMMVLALAFFITELTDSMLGIFVQVVWAFFSLMSSGTLTGSFGMKLVARWNTTGASLQFQQEQSALLLNRGFYGAAALVLIGLTVCIFAVKRRKGGRIIGTLRHAGKELS